MTRDFLTLEDKPIEILGGEPYNIVLFDINGRIATRVGTDTPFLKKNNFFALLSDEEMSFFDEWGPAFGQKKLLLESTRGPVLIFNGLFRETGLFVALLFHTPRETLRGFWKNGFWRDVKVSPLLIEKTLPQKGGNEKDIFEIVECVGMLDPIFSPGVRPIPRQDGGWLVSVLGRMIGSLARAFGCSVSIREAKRVLLGEAWAFSLPSFAAVIACLVSLAARVSVVEKTTIDIYEEDGRVFVRLDTELAYWRDKVSKAHRCEYPELKECERIAERHDLFLNVAIKHKDESAALTVLFSPQYADVSFFGLKNPLGFDY